MSVLSLFLLTIKMKNIYSNQLFKHLKSKTLLGLFPLDFQCKMTSLQLGQKEGLIRRLTRTGWIMKR